MKKRITGLVLTALLLISMISPAAVYAEGDGGKHNTNVTDEVSAQKENDVVTQEADSVTATQEADKPVTQAEGKTIYVAGREEASGEKGDDSNPGTTEDKPVETLKKAVELAGENGTVVVLRTVFIREETVLDNNVTIKRGGECSVGMIYLGQSNLTINRATIDGNKEEYPDSSSALISVYNSPKITINDGAKLCNNAKEAIWQAGSGTTGPVVTMNGGEVCDNNTKNTNSRAAISLNQDAGALYIKGGSIHDNIGGGIDVGCSTFEMTGGQIYNNDSTTCSGNFGGVYVRSENGTISGGEIYNNTSSYAGGVKLAGRGNLTLTGDAKIHDNTASYGGGVYAVNGKFIMTGGTISNNIGKAFGGAIFQWNFRESVSNDALRSRVAISGGVIEGNTDGKNPSGIDFYEDKDNITDIPVGSPILELSGSPTIKDPIYLDDYINTNAKVDVVGEFTPTEAVPIYDFNWTDNRVIVSYKDGLTAKKEDFVKHNKTKTQDIKVDGQNLLSINIPIQSFHVVFKEQDDSESYGTITVDENDKIDVTNVPKPTKGGYVLAGWRTADKNWDFENDAVTGNLELYPIWKLEAPEFVLVTDRDHLHEDDDQDVTIVAQIAIKGDNALTYNWKWYKDGNPVDGANDNVLNVSEAGVYKAEATVTNGTDSSDPTSKEIEITKTNHIASGDWEHDQTDHWKICDECGKNAEKAAHTFGEWTTVSRAGAKRERVCTVCGYKVTENIPETKKYNVLYEFESGTKGKALPKAVKDLLPGDDTEYEVGTVVAAKMPTQTTVEVSGGRWVFAGYDVEQDVIVEDIIFTGTWVYEKKANEYSVNYEFVSGTKGKKLPKEVTALLPEDASRYEEGLKVQPKQPTQTEVSMKTGKWVFNGYDADEKIVSDDTVFTGVWNFVKEGNYNPPVIFAKDVTVPLGRAFEAKSLARAVDVEDGDITDRIEVVKDAVDTSKTGNYEVTYQVTNSYELTTLSTITVTVASEDAVRPVEPKEDNITENKPGKESRPNTGSRNSSNSIKSADSSASSSATSESGTVSAKSAHTGDTNPVAVYGIIVLICAVGIVVLIRRKRTK